ncbi:hypothetical protein SISSUDRAFT_1060396 [Sistotremastrum suecicum HHB10207 ss-3]|uniref:Uncharacterized protein n=1 Tax=Sistotremastrum suecicum HHB10207 ss-3 TaxID=1314776 RepID=A0A166F686_9AGAM|nr:hypothetical protein SISSUDRAFT_1060396 [Sistotremastrum suecicum HHB10207 ss-3]
MQHDSPPSGDPPTAITTPSNLPDRLPAPHNVSAASQEPANPQMQGLRDGDIGIRVVRVSVEAHSPVPERAYAFADDGNSLVRSLEEQAEAEFDVNPTPMIEADGASRKREPEDQGEGRGGKRWCE